MTLPDPDDAGFSRAGSLDRPVFIVGNPRSGTTLMRTYLERSATLARLGRESRFVWDRFTHPFDDERAAWRDAQREPDTWDGAALDAARSTLTAAYLRHAAPLDRATPDPDDDHLYRFAERVAQQGASPWYYDLPAEVLASRPDWPLPEGPFADRETPEIAPFTPPPPTPRDAPLPPLPRSVRLLDKDTGHVWRIPLLVRLFPDARFVFVTRDGRATVSSLIEAWRHPRWFFSYRMPASVELDIAGYSDALPWGRRWWNLNLPPDWPDLVHRPLQEVCAQVWARGNAEILAHAPALVAHGRAVVVRYEDLLTDPARVMGEMAPVIDIDVSTLGLDGYRPPPVVTDAPPAHDKWHRNADLVDAVAHEIEEMQTALGYPVAS
jgi:hypothetical protein